jgi:hypothetical protein
MSATRLFAALLTALLISTMLAVAAKPNNSAAAAMKFAKVAKVNGVAASISGEVGPRSFFEHLHREGSGTNTKFFYKKNEVQSFPERLTIRVSLLGGGQDGQRFSPDYFDKAYMEAIKFRAEWKTGEEVRPVRSLRELTPSATRKPANEKPYGGWDLWGYKLELDDKDVPLSDYLLLYVVSPENQEIVRFSVHL